MKSNARMKNLKGLFTLSFLVIVLGSCYYDKADKLYPASTGGCDTTNVTYALTVKPIIVQNCATSGCHDAGSQSGGYNFTNYADLKTAVESGRLIGDIYQQVGFNPMPKTGAKLSNCDLSKISVWVNNGALNN